MKRILSRLFAANQTLTQYAALPYRPAAGGAWEVAMVTSRGTGRWVLPKGWPEPGMSPPELAANEAREEAGMIGRIGAHCIGSYRYRKQLHLLASASCRVDVYPLRVETVLGAWDEQSERQRAWFAPAAAAAAVDETELAALLRAFQPAEG